MERQPGTAPDPSSQFKVFPEKVLVMDKITGNLLFSIPLGLLRYAILKYIEYIQFPVYPAGTVHHLAYTDFISKGNDPLFYRLQMPGGCFHDHLSRMALHHR